MTYTDEVPSFAQRAKKAVAGFVVPVLTVVAIVAPNYSDEAKAAVGLLGAVLSSAAVYKVRNELTPQEIEDQYFESKKP